MTVGSLLPEELAPKGNQQRILWVCALWKETFKINVLFCYKGEIDKVL